MLYCNVMELVSFYLYIYTLIDNIEIIGSQNIGHAFHNKITKVIKSDIANKQIAGVLIINFII